MVGKWVQNLISVSGCLAKRSDPAFCSEEAVDEIQGAMTPHPVMLFYLSCLEAAQLVCMSLTAFSLASIWE